MPVIFYFEIQKVRVALWSVEIDGVVTAPPSLIRGGQTVILTSSASNEDLYRLNASGFHRLLRGIYMLQTPTPVQIQV
jgi:hypothetical protein